MQEVFRARTFEEYVRVLKKRKWFFVLPAAAVALAVFGVVRRLPDTYRATASLTIQSPRISGKLVESLSDDDMSRRVQAITQSILSRATLEKLIGQFGLYEKERAKGMSMDVAVEMLRKNVAIDVDNDGKGEVVGFRVSVSAPSAETARQVTNAVADAFVNQRSAELAQTAETTNQVIDEQLRKAREDLAGIEKERLRVMTENVGSLPESAQSLIAQLDGLRRREESLARERESLANEKGRLADQLAVNQRQANLVREIAAKESRKLAADPQRIEGTAAYAQLVNRRAELSAQLDKLARVYKEKHPDVIAKRDEIARVNEEIEALKKSAAASRPDPAPPDNAQAELQMRSLEIENQRIQSSIARIDEQMRQKESDGAVNGERIAALEAKVDKIPSITIALESIAPRYESAKAAYDGLLEKYNKARGQVGRETMAQGETISVVDRANLPMSPQNASKRPIVVAGGVVAGLIVGIFLTFIAEMPRWRRVQDTRDMQYFTGLGKVFSVSEIRSRNDEARLLRRRIMMGATAVLICFGSIPVLMFVIQRLGLLERFL